MSDALLNPRLLVISGPNTGAVYFIPMDGVEVTAGRAADNAICVSTLSPQNITLPSDGRVIARRCTTGKRQKEPKSTGSITSIRI